VDEVFADIDVDEDFEYDENGMTVNLWRYGM
jgi:hypothetical protein